jgi:hypothetical protein
MALVMWSYLGLYISPPSPASVNLRDVRRPSGHATRCPATAGDHRGDRTGARWPDPSTNSHTLRHKPLGKQTDKHTSDDQFTETAVQLHSQQNWTPYINNGTTWLAGGLVVELLDIVYLTGCYRSTARRFIKEGKLLIWMEACVQERLHNPQWKLHGLFLYVKQMD